MGPARLAALTLTFPFEDVFVGDLGSASPARGSGSGGAGETMATTLLSSFADLASRRSLLEGRSLRTVVHSVLVEAGVPPSQTETLTFAAFHRRFGRELRVLALNLCTHRPFEFSMHTTPSTPVLDACVASMTVPGMFPPVRINPYGDFVDGAIGDPYGLSLFPEAPPRSRLHIYKYWRAGGYDASREPGLLPIITHCTASMAERSLDTLPPAVVALTHMPLVFKTEVVDRAASAVSALNLFAPPDTAELLRQGARSAETRLLALWILVRLALRR